MVKHGCRRGFPTRLREDAERDAHHLTNNHLTNNHLTNNHLTNKSNKYLLGHCAAGAAAAADTLSKGRLFEGVADGISPQTPAISDGDASRQFLAIIFDHLYLTTMRPDFGHATGIWGHIPSDIGSVPSRTILKYVELYINHAILCHIILHINMFYITFNINYINALTQPSRRTSLKPLLGIQISGQTMVKCVANNVLYIILYYIILYYIILYCGGGGT